MRSYIWQILLATLLLVIYITGTDAVRCYECNVWKAGYGHLCDNPRIRDDCKFCMKIHSTVEMGYYKNTPRKSEITSRVCGRSRYQHFSHECWHVTAVSGTTVRCYCDTNLCNSATKRTFSVLSLSALIFACIFTIWH